MEIYDYVARQRGNDIPVFLAGDQMAEQSYEWSPYAYGYNNPMRYTDPTGMTASDTTIYELKDIVIDGAAKGAKNAGTNIFILFAGGAGASILSNLALATSPVTYSRDFNVLGDFIWGTGPEHRDFDESSPSTQSLKKSHLTKMALVKIREEIKQGVIEGHVRVGFNPTESKYSGPFSDLVHSKGYSTAQFVGSAKYNFEVSGSNVNITVENKTSLRSGGLHLPVLGEPSRSETPFGMMGNITQSYTFSVPLHQLK